MPIYEFECLECGQSFEDLVRFEAIKDVRCPTCGGALIKRRVSRFASSSKGISAGEPGGTSCSGAGT